MMTAQELEAKVRLYFDVAKANGSLLLLSELLALVPEHESEEQLERAIRSTPELASRYTLESGFIVERPNSDSEKAAAERSSRTRAHSNLAYAERIIPLLNRPSLLLLGISGSTSYRSASKSRDLDMFCVTPNGMLWLFLTRALIVTRVLQALKIDAPPVCLSCIMDAKAAETSFASANDSLFARDALSMIVAVGEDYYQGLLAKGSWISGFYPKIYSQKLRAGHPAPRPSPEASAASRVLNKLLYYIVGTYVRVKSWRLNRQLAKRGRNDSTFNLLIGEDRCLYESTRYVRMRRMYRLLRAD
jgi:hypothetical protein